MVHETTIYGLDIETDTSRDGLDPAIASIRAIALSSRAFDDLFVGDEATMLRALDQRLAGLPAGVLATWNGATFDLPFLADRARILGLDLQLRLRVDRALTLSRTPLPGHPGAYRGTWHHHGHLDTYRLYGGGGRAQPRLSFRSLGRMVGIGAPEAPRARTDDLANEALHAHAPSDARLARVLAERRWPAAARLVDRFEADEAQPVAVAAQRLARQQQQAEGLRRRPAVAGL